MSDTILNFENKPGVKIRQNEPMSAHTPFRVGGPAECYAEVDTLDTLTSLVREARSVSIPVFVFGAGSNIIISDKGIRGLVIKNNCRKFEVASMKGSIRGGRLDMSYALVVAESGAIMNQVVRFTIDEGLSGLEYALGLPGTVGGAVYTNAEFSKKTMRISDVVDRVRILTKNGEVQELHREEIADSAGKSKFAGTGAVILSVIFKLTPYDKKTLWQRGTDTVTHRTETAPSGAAIGYAFRNIGLSDAMRLPTPGHTTSPEFLLSQAGLRGKRIGHAVVSEINPNYILNAGHATAKDIAELIQYMKDAVFRKFGVELIAEVQIIGE